MRPLDLVELEGPSDGLDDVVGGAADAASLELRVVLDADPGQHRHLFASKAADATSSAVGTQTGLRRGDAGAAGGQELSDLVGLGHVLHGRALPDRRGRGWQYPYGPHLPIREIRAHHGLMPATSLLDRPAVQIAVPAARGASDERRRRSITLAAAVLGFFIVTLDAVVVNVA